MRLDTRTMVRAGAIAAAYVAITLTPGIRELSFREVQVRVAEALTVLPFLDPGAGILGISVGVALANWLGSPFGWPDFVFGTASSLVAAMWTARVRRPVLAPFPPVLVNAIVVPVYLQFLTQIHVGWTIAWVFAGQLVACYGIGYPLLLALQARAAALGLPARRT
ncbi:MAG: QueT transporter family protein [Armatimonadetes bacterium]|nr:QueT transporter family protein [Armatimonadota bacterium]